MKLFGRDFALHAYLDRLAMASFFIVGVVTAWSGFNYPMMYFDATFVSFEPYHVTKLILSFCLLVMAFIMLKSNHMSTAILSALVGLSTFTFSISELLYHIDGDATMDLVFSFPIMAIAVFKFYQGRRFRAVAIGLLGVSMLIVSVFSGNLFSLVGGIGFVLSGFMMMLMGIVGLIRNIKTEYDKRRDYGYEMIAIAGLLFMAMYAILSSVEVYSLRYYVVSICLSSLTALVAVRALQDGIVIEGIVMFMFGFSGITFSLARMFGGEGYVITDMAVAAVIGICGVLLLLRKQYVLGIAFTGFGLLVLPGFLFEQGFSWSMGSMWMAPFIIYYALSRWIFVETGKAPLPMWE